VELSKKPSPITFTQSALDRAKFLINNANDNVLGIRIGIDSTGCSGFSYKVEYATEEKKLEDIIDIQGIKFFIDPSAVMFLLGSELDYRESKMERGFIFNNPNETGRCGCGESFSVDKKIGSS
tara:strand:+ start:360 stop:728 length:369 start_codon:yes stop_codon:yes gene_type:complete